MSNPLISFMANQANSSNPAMQMLSRFQQFKNAWTPETAQAQINEMLRTGQINAQQLEQAKQMANQWASLFNSNNPQARKGL